MEADVKAVIRNAYQAEYQSDAIKDVKGIGGWLLHISERFEQKVTEADKANSWKVIPYLAVPVVLGAYAIMAGLLFAPLATAAVVGAGIWSKVSAVKQQKAIADAALDRDIENGTLLSRYNAEFLQSKIDNATKELETLLKVKSSLPLPGAAAAEFANAVKPQEPVVETQKSTPAAPSNTGPA